MSKIMCSVAVVLTGVMLGGSPRTLGAVDAGPAITSPAVPIGTSANAAGNCPLGQPGRIDVPDPPPTAECLADIFVKACGEPDATDVVNDAIVTRDGDIAVTGYRSGTSKNVLIARFRSDGTVRYKGVFGGSQDEEGRGIVETQDGDLVVVGYTRSHGDGSDFLIVRLAGDGSPWRWTRFWGGGAGRDDELSAVLEASDGTLWTTGFTESFTLLGRREVVIARIDPEGASLACSRAYSADWNLTGSALAEVFNTDGFCVTGTASNVFGEDVLLAKFSHTPSLLWGRRFSSADMTASATAIVRTSDACLALAGNVTYWDGMYMNAGSFVLKTDPGAALDWARLNIGFAQYQHYGIRALFETRDASLLTLGDSYDFWDPLPETVWLSKMTFGGYQSWSTGFDATADGVGASVAEEAQGTLIVAGSILGEDGYSDLMLARCASNGATCRSSSAGPGFDSWSPEEHVLVLVGTEFPAALSDWSGFIVSPSWQFTTICTPTVHTVCADGSAEFLAIQDAIDAASDGEIVELCSAVFNGPRDRDLDFQGKSLILRSAGCDPATCTIDCQHAGRAFRFHSNEGLDCLIEGLTILNGLADGGMGGGVSCEGAAPRIVNCRFQDCAADDGGAIFADGVTLIMQQCAIQGCQPNGVMAIGSTADIQDCAISGCPTGFSFVQGVSLNAQGWVVWDNDTGIDLHTSTGEFTNCTIADNPYAGMTLMYSDAELHNCIAWGNGTQILLIHTEPPEGSSALVSCSDIQGGWTGVYNIDADPLFCSPQAGNYHIRYESPCAPAQQPICGLIGALDPACRSGDLNCDDLVNAFDIDPFVLALTSAPSFAAYYAVYPDCEAMLADVNCDGAVNVFDIDPFVWCLVGGGCAPCPP